MKPKAIIDLPKSATEEALERVRKEVESSFNQVDITYEYRNDISHPIARKFDRNGTDVGYIDWNDDAPSDLGCIDRDYDAYSIAMIANINRVANEAFNKRAQI